MPQLCIQSFLLDNSKLNLDSRLVSPLSLQVIMEALLAPNEILQCPDAGGEDTCTAFQLFDAVRGAALKKKRVSDGYDMPRSRTLTIALANRCGPQGLANPLYVTKRHTHHTPPTTLRHCRTQTARTWQSGLSGLRRPRLAGP